MKFNWKKTLSMVALCTAVLSVRAFAMDCGEYIKLGTYNQADILWRVVAVDEEKMTLLSDEIITLKAFDAKGTHANGTSFTADGGNGLWSTSNLRTWLNSSETSVTWGSDPTPSASNVTANPYDTEPGFLTNFTAEEQAVFTTGSYLTVLNHQNQSLKSEGTETHLYSRDPSKVSQNYNAAYKQELSDMVFLPSIADIQNISDSIHTYGLEYQVASLAATLQPPSGAGDGSGWFYWLRDSLFAADDSLVRCMRPDNTVEFDRANNGNVGVRPMCYIKSKLAIMSGNGSKENPYIVRHTPQIRLSTGGGVQLAGATATLDIASILLPEGGTVKLYRGSEYLGQTNGDKISVMIEQGANIITAEMYDAAGELVTVSAPILVTGVSFLPTGRVLRNLTFEGISPQMLLSDKETAGFTTVSSFDDSNDVRDSYGKFMVEYDPVRKSNVVKLQSVNTSKNAVAQLHNFPKNYQVLTVEMDFSLETLNAATIKAFGFSALEANGTRTWLSPIMIDLAGSLRLQQVKSEPRVLTAIEEGKWYNLKMLIHNSTNAFHAILTEEGKEPQLLCYNEILETPGHFSYINYGEFSFRNASATPFSMAIDNLTVSESTQDTSGNETMLYGAHLMDDKKTVSVSLYNKATERTEPMVMAVVRSRRRMLSLAYSRVELDPQSPGRVLLALEEEVPADAEVKVLVWDGFSGITPQDTALTLSK